MRRNVAPEESASIATMFVNPANALVNAADMPLPQAVTVPLPPSARLKLLPAAISTTPDSPAGILVWPGVVAAPDGDDSVVRPQGHAAIVIGRDGNCVGQIKRHVGLSQRGPAPPQAATEAGNSFLTALATAPNEFEAMSV